MEPSADEAAPASPVDAETPFQRYMVIQSENPPGGGMVVEAIHIWRCLLEAQMAYNITGSFAEIGVFKGYGAALMAAFVRSGEQLHLMDRFTTLDDAAPAISRVKPLTDLDIVFHSEDSLRLTQKDALRDAFGSFRWAHVDGEHTYEAVLSDMALCDRLLADTGILVVDDIFNFTTPQLTQALFEYCSKTTTNLVPFLFGYNKAYLCRRRYVGFYRRFLPQLLDLLEAENIRAQICVSSWSWDLPYVGIAPRHGDSRFQLIGRYTNNISELNIF